MSELFSAVDWVAVTEIALGATAAIVVGFVLYAFLSFMAYLLSRYPP